jgi:uncharacterized protein YjbJ (UPF0337 family)
MTGESDGRDGAYDGGGKSPDQIEEDISETRAELGEILDQLERKLAPRHLLERGVDMLKDSMSGDVGGLGDTFRRNPVPLALIGIGIGWMAFGATTRRGQVGQYGGELRQKLSGAVQGAAGKVGAAAGQLRDKVAGMTSTGSAAPGPYPTESAGYAYARQKSGEAMAQARETAAEASSGGRNTLGRAQEAGSAAWAQASSGASETRRRLREAGSAAWQRASGYAGKAGDRMLVTRDRLGDMLEANPLAVGALGFLAGALLALMLPRTDMETQLIGDTSEQIRTRAAEGARRVAERTVDAAVGAVKEEVSETADAASAPSGGGMGVPPG